MVQLSLRTVFVGRDRELGELSNALDEAESGRGRVVLLAGEPGIGKTRLMDELAGRARDRHFSVLWGRGWEDAGAPAYWVWIQSLRAFVRSTPAEELRRLLGAGAADLAQILPELRDLFPDLPPPADAESDAARFRLFDSTASLLRNAARANPLLLALDDLHAADLPSILLLRFVAGQLSDVPAMIVATCRDFELPPVHPLMLAIGEIARDPIARTLSLHGLEPGAVAEFIRGSADVTLQDRLVTAVWRATSGNPLFLGEAVRLLSSDGRLREVADVTSLKIAVPAGVRVVIARRIGQLSGPAAELLRVGAAVGPEFGLEVVRSAAGFDAEETLNLVDEAASAGLLQAAGAAAGRYRFSHDLVRETLYDELPPGRRGRLHARIAEVLESVYGTAADAHAAEISFHLVQAALAEGGTGTHGGAVTEKAIRFACLAADEAARSTAYEEAARLYRMALEVLALARPSENAARLDILLHRGDAESRAGDLDGARATFLEASELARKLGAWHDFAAAALGYGGRFPWARPGKHTRLIGLLQEALETLGDEDDLLRVRLLTRLACAWRSAPERRPDSARLSAEAVEIARRLGDPATLCYALSGRFWAIWWPENPAEREVLAREMGAIADAAGDGERIADAHLMLFLSYSERGDMAASREELRIFRLALNELRQPAPLWLGRANRAQLALMEGEYALAEGLIEHEADDHLVVPARDDVSALRIHRFIFLREKGRVGEAEADLRASVDDFPWYPLHRAALGLLLAETGRLDEARDMLAELSRDGFHALYRDNEWLFGMSLAAELTAELGDTEGARVAYELLAPFAGRHAVGHPEGSLGAVDRYLGLLAATLGRMDDAIGHMAAALEINERMGARPLTAHTRHDLATLLRLRDGPGDREQAESLDRSAAELATALDIDLARRIDVSDEPVVGIDPAIVTFATFRREGEYWTIQFGSDSFRLRDAKGLRHLSRLLEAPGREFHCLDLAGGAVRAGGEAHAGRPAESRASFEKGAEFGARDAVGPLLDAEAKAAYRSRLDELAGELAEAERWNDTERAARLASERQALLRELTAAVGLAGRDRSAISNAERARVSVTRAIRTAIDRIAAESADLGAHLGASIRTGTYCSYMPDPRAPISWRT